LGDEKTRARGERGLQELLIVRVAADGQASALRLRNGRVDALRDAAALGEAGAAARGVERALLPQVVRQRPLELRLAGCVDEDLAAPSAESSSSRSGFGSPMRITSSGLPKTT